MKERIISLIQKVDPSLSVISCEESEKYYIVKVQALPDDIYSIFRYKIDKLTNEISNYTVLDAFNDEDNGIEFKHLF